MRRLLWTLVIVSGCGPNLENAMKACNGEVGQHRCECLYQQADNASQAHREAIWHAAQRCRAGTLAPPRAEAGIL